MSYGYLDAVSVGNWQTWYAHTCVPPVFEMCHKPSCKYPAIAAMRGVRVAATCKCSQHSGINRKRSVAHRWCEVKRHCRSERHSRLWLRRADVEITWLPITKTRCVNNDVYIANATSASSIVSEMLKAAWGAIGSDADTFVTENFKSMMLTRKPECSALVVRQQEVSIRV